MEVNDGGYYSPEGNDRDDKLKRVLPFPLESSIKLDNGQFMYNT